MNVYYRENVLQLLHHALRFTKAQNNISNARFFCFFFFYESMDSSQKRGFIFRSNRGFSFPTEVRIYFPYTEKRGFVFLTKAWICRIFGGLQALFEDLVHVPLPFDGILANISGGNLELVSIT